MTTVVITTIIITVLCVFLQILKRNRKTPISNYADQSRYSRIIIFFVMATLIVVIGFRYSYADTRNYKMGYNAIPENIDELFAMSKSPGFDLIQWLLRLISTDPQFICIAMAVIFTVIDVWFIRKHSYDFPLSLFMYFLLYFASNMNGLRQGLAAVFMLPGFVWACRKRRARYIALALLLSTIHKSVLITIPLMFLFSGKRLNTGLVIFAAFCCLSAFFPDPINFLIGNLVSDDYAHYIYNYAAQANILHVLVEAVPLALGIIYHLGGTRTVVENRALDVLINMQVIRFSFMVLATRMAQYARIGMYMRHVPLLLVPMIIPYVFKGKSAYYVKLIAAVLYLTEFLLEMYISMNGGRLVLDFRILGFGV